MVDGKALEQFDTELTAAYPPSTLNTLTDLEATAESRFFNDAFGLAITVRPPLDETTAALMDVLFDPYGMTSSSDEWMTSAERGYDDPLDVIDIVPRAAESPGE